MKDYFTYEEVPKNYLHCQNPQCPRSADCLRFQVALRIDANTPSYLTVNPAYVAGKKECPYYHPDRLTRFAEGITYMFDNLPYKQAIKVKKILYDHFKRSKFYRIQNKEYLINPEEQAFIREVFRKEGIEEAPLFDRYVEKYAWS